MAAVVETESSWDINAGDNVDSYGSYGLGQLIAMNASSYPQYKPGDANGQLDTVGEILSQNYKATGNWDNAISAYNTGLGGYNSAAGQHYLSVVKSHMGGATVPSSAGSPAASATVAADTTATGTSTGLLGDLTGTTDLFNSVLGYLLDAGMIVAGIVTIGLGGYFVFKQVRGS